MNILLVEPRTPETFWSLRHALRFVGRRAANPPLGLLTVSRGDNTRAVFNFETRLDRVFLQDNDRQLMHRLYEPANYYRRIRTFLASHRMRGPRASLTWRDLRAVLTSLWLMGVVHHGRGAYWRFLTGTLLRHPSQIGVAITMAITGHHFRRVAEGL